MIEIKREENIKEAIEFLRKQKNETDITGAIVMSAKEKGEILAVAALFLKEYKVFLDLLVATDEIRENSGFMLGVLKSLLNLADLRGIKTVYGSNPNLKNYYKLLRFQKSMLENSEVYELSLEGYFSCDCTHES